MTKSNFQFLSPYLTEIHFEVNPNFSSELYDNNIQMQNAFHIQVKRDEKQNKANVELALETNINNDDAPFKMRIKMASDFSWTKLNKEEIDTMLSLNAPAILLGYMRPIVANITASSNFPVYNLPFINFGE